MPPIRLAKPDIFGHPSVSNDMRVRHAGDRTRPTPYRKADRSAQITTETSMTSSPLHETCLIVDFGSQVTQLIARRLRESGIYCEIHPFQSVDDALIDRLAPKAVILSGGPASVSDADSPRANQRLFELGVPVLGICYGQMVMVHQLGGHAEGGHHREFGRAFVRLERQSDLFAGIAAPGEEEEVWMSHGDRVTALPPGFGVQGASPNAPFAVLADPERRFYGVMFHPEVVHTPKGSAILRNFTHRIAGMSGDWTMAAYKDQAIEEIRAQVGDARVICGLSGGVDSSVAAVLIHEAIGDQLTCVFVDTGMMRANEAEQVVGLFRDRWPGSPTRKPNARSSAGCLSMSSTNMRAKPAARSSWHRGRCTRM
jgi:GMP synthase (glutamine-hydrolysing)